MTKPLVVVMGILFIGVVGFVIFWKKQPVQIGCTPEAKLCPDGSAVGRSGPLCEFAPCPDVSQKVPSDVTPKTNISELVSPLIRANMRITKKPFGVFITPATSPVQPEKFRGYHTGTDFETFPDEASIDVPVTAVCGGEVVTKRSATGYGGVLVMRCTIGEQAGTVIYGHMRLTSIKAAVGDSVTAGDVLGVLGTGYSQETDGERKHLHLGIHIGTTINILGYVQEKQALRDWLDPCQYFSCFQ